MARAALNRLVARLQAAAHRFDAFQQRHRVLAFPLAVQRKLGDDEAGNLAAMMTFFAFVSLFPLLLVLVTVLGIVLRHNPGLQKSVLDSAVADFPIIGDQLKTNIHGLGRSGLGLAVGIVGTVLGARGLASSAQDAVNRLWAVPHTERPGFPFSWLRSYGLIAVLGVGALGTATLANLAARAGGGSIGIGLRCVLFLGSLAVTVPVSWLGLRLAAARQVPGRPLWLGALVAACGWQVLQLVGGYVVAHELRHASSLYGVFGLVLGLLAWLYLQAKVALYAVEIDVVRTKKLWPRSLFPPPLTPEDRQAYAAYRDTEQRTPEA